MVKKILFAFTLTFFATALFAQNSDYDRLLARAKEYEKKNQYAYALGYYYDAMEARVEDCDEAFKGWQKITDAIKSGMPGLKNYSAFALHDEWMNLLKDAEKYWRECPYWGVDVEKIELADLDYDNKTANYSARIRVCETEKNKTIRDLILNGLMETFSATQFYMNTSEQEELWPAHSLFEEKGIVSHLFLSVRLSVVDKDGKTIMQGNNFVLDTKKHRIELGDDEDNGYTYKNYTWRDASPNVVAVIESGEYQITPVGYAIEYMVFDDAGNKDNSKSNKTQFALDRAEFRIQGQKGKPNVFDVIKKKQEAEAKRKEKENKILPVAGVNTRDELLQKIIEDNRLTKIYTSAFGSKYLDYVCNTLSEIFECTPAYSYETGELITGSNGFYCGPNAETPDFYRGGQSVQTDKIYYIHSNNPELEEKIQASIQRKIEERAKLLEEQKPTVRTNILKFLVKTKAAKDAIVKKFKTEAYSQEYIEERIAELEESAFIEADKKGKYGVTAEGKAEIGM